MKYVQWNDHIKVTEEDNEKLMNDLMYLGTCYVVHENEIGRRIAPEDIFMRNKEWPETTEISALKDSGLRIKVVE